METANLLKRIINAYSKKKNDWNISYDELLAFVNNLVMNDESGRYEVFSTNTHDVLTAMLISMEESGQCGLRYSGTVIEGITNRGFITYAVKSEYEKIESNSDRHFPSEHSLGIEIPDDTLVSLAMPDNLAAAMNKPDEDGRLYKMLFLEGVSPIICTGAVIKGRLLVLAVNKIRNYLAYKNNANYIYQKMLPVFKKNTRALVDIIKMVQSNPGRAATGIKKPDEFLFTFWTQLCSFIRKQLADKENKTSQDEGLLHSSILINAYILYYKNIILRQKEKESALKFVGDQLRKEPFFYTISDIYSFRDKSGPLLDKKYKREDLHEFLEKKFELKDNQALPELLKIKTVDNKLFYIHKTVFLNLVHRKVSAAHDYYRKVYLDSWSKDLRMYKTNAEMKNDDRFHADLEKRIKKEDPLLYALLGYELLVLNLQDSKNIKLKAVIEGWIDRKIHATKPLPIVLDLQRRHLVSEVRSNVPFWLTIGFFRKLASIFGGKKRKKAAKNESADTVNDVGSRSAVPRSTAPSKKMAGKTAEYKRSLDVLKNRYNYSTHTIDNNLSTLADEWNPLLDYEARNNLVKDLKTMIRDYIRKILRETSFAVPDEERVENIAELLAGNSAFSMIKKKEKFKRYISLYIIKILSETRP